jgi:beta-galactosidase
VATETAARFTEPLATDWTPTDLSPHTETLEIYTTAEEVELFLNGKSLGTQKLHPDATPITYKVAFEPGTLKAEARSGGKVVATEELKTAGKPARLVFTPELNPDATTRPLTPEWNDVRYVTATLVDDAGTRIPDSSTLVHFSASGPASIIAVDNGNMLDHDPFQATQRKLYDGHAVAILRATGAAGRVTVTARADGVAPASITLSTAPASQEDPTLAKAVGSERSF